MTRSARASSKLWRLRRILPHALRSTLAVFLMSPPAMAQDRVLQGVTRLVTPVGVAAGNDPTGPCGLGWQEFERHLIVRLEESGFPAISTGEVLAIYSHHVTEARAHSQAAEAGALPPPGFAEESRQRRAEGEELRHRPSFNISLATRPVRTDDGSPGCVLVMRGQLRTGSTTGRVSVGVSGREVYVSLLLWQSRLRMDVVPTADWATSTHRQLDDILAEFMERWRQDNQR